MDHQDLDEIYAFWFGSTPADALDTARIGMWMVQSDATDCAIRERFGALLPKAATIDWDIRELSRRQAVALVVLFDQFPRNLYRVSGEAFAYDPLARELARRLIATGWDRFTPMEQVLLGLPFVHHEDIKDQTYALQLACGIVVDLAPDTIEEEHRLVDQTIRHWELIRRFGRFPHRNAMLGRKSTPEEVEFLSLHGRGF